MAHYYVFADKDTTLLRGNDVDGTGSLKNQGYDEILEVGKTFKENSTEFNSVCRALIQFPITAISESVANGEIGSDVKFYLNLYDAGATEVKDSTIIYANAVSQSWTEGTGKLINYPQTTDGASWKYRTASTESKWATVNSRLGGTWYEASSSSYAFDKNKSFDPRFDVTGIVNSWISGSISNDGFIIKRDSSEETSSTDYGMYKFFSSDTHTVFPPKLEAVWDDSLWVTGSLAALASSELDQLKINLENFNHEYKVGTLTKIRVKGREKYPSKTFATTSEYLTVKTLPSASTYYSIIDDKTEDIIVPYGAGSKISCDASGNFFKLRTTGIQPERFYRLEFKIESGSGINKTVQYYDGHHQFKVVR